MLDRVFETAKNIDGLISNLFTFPILVKGDFECNIEKCEKSGATSEQKLHDSHLKLSPQDRINLLLKYIHEGEKQVTKALHKNAVVMWGGTASCKSTTINYLFGCTMQKVNPRDLGLTGFSKIVTV